MRKITYFLNGLLMTAKVKNARKGTTEDKKAGIEGRAKAIPCMKSVNTHMTPVK